MATDIPPIIIVLLVAVGTVLPLPGESGAADSCGVSELRPSDSGEVPAGIPETVEILIGVCDEDDSAPDDESSRPPPSPAGPARATPPDDESPATPIPDSSPGRVPDACRSIPAEPQPTEPDRSAGQEGQDAESGPARPGERPEETPDRADEPTDRPDTVPPDEATDDCAGVDDTGVDEAGVDEAGAGEAGAGEAGVDGNFPQLEPGAELPSEEECAGRVRRDGWEPRPENDEANNTVPDGETSTASWGGGEADTLLARVTGDFTGTTDEIIHWASCKWGFEPDVTRAQAVQESGWDQSARGDGGVSYGLLQIKSTAWDGTLPWSRDSTAYNVDWSLGMRRACFEGYIHDEGRGDLWGCIGSHYSGQWMDSGATSYIDRVQGHLAGEAWRDVG